MSQATKEQFAEALTELINDHADRGMDEGECIGPLKAEIVRIRRHILLPSKSDDKYNAERGLPPMTEEQIRKALQLEPYEPIPPQRENN